MAIGAVAAVLLVILGVPVLLVGIGYARAVAKRQIENSASSGQVGASATYTAGEYRAMAQELVVLSGAFTLDQRTMTPERQARARFLMELADKDPVFRRYFEVEVESLPMPQPTFEPGNPLTFEPGNSR
jgi:hypothetical protein